MENAIVVTGARFVNLSWYDPVENAITGSAWSVRPTGAMDELMRAAHGIVAGFNPLQVRFSGDVNPAVHAVLVEGRSLLAPFTEHAAGTVHPALLRIAETVAGLRWTFAVPLRVADGIVGSLAYHYLERPSPTTLRAAEAFAQQAALTVENLRLSEALERRAAQLEGSTARIAAAEQRTRRETAELLQGRIATRILVATQRLLACRDAAAADPAGAGAALDGIAEEIERIREEDVRGASHRLHPSAIQVGLLPALELLADALEPRVEVTVEASAAAVELDDLARNALPDRLRVAVYRFVEEALGNVARHSGARTARVDVDVVRSMLRVRVMDTGRGFDPASGREGAGLQGMRDHIERLGGAMVVVSVPEGGTSVEASVPIGEGARAEERRRFPRRTSPSEVSVDARGMTEPFFQQIAENALAATGARFVSLSWYRSSDGTHELGAVAPLGGFRRALNAVQALVPGFDPARIRFRADVNPATRAVLIEGRPLLAPLFDHGAGTIHPTVLQVASSVLNIRWTHSVPLRSRGEVLGALAFHFPDRPTEGALAVAEALAKQVALTLENARLTRALHERAEELSSSRESVAASEESTRREIAELLHGRVQTRLLVAAHRLLEARSSLATEPLRARAAMTEVASELDRIREQDVERASRQLRPEALRLGLVVALRELADAIGPRLDVRVEVSPAISSLDHPLGERLPEPVRLGIYRFVEEALANVARHAGVPTATVRLELEGGREVSVTVSDAGHGADPAAVEEGLGIRTMRDRIARSGGSLRIDSSPGAGTTLVATLPIGLG